MGFEKQSRIEQANTIIYSKPINTPMSNAYTAHFHMEPYMPQGNIIIGWKTNGNRDWSENMVIIFSSYITREKRNCTDQIFQSNSEHLSLSHMNKHNSHRQSIDNNFIH